MKAVEGIIAVLAFVLLVFNKQVGEIAMQWWGDEDKGWSGIHPAWALIPVAFVFLDSLCRAMHKEYVQLEESSAKLEADKDILNREIASLRERPSDPGPEVSKKWIRGYASGIRKLKTDRTPNMTLETLDERVHKQIKPARTMLLDTSGLDDAFHRLLNRRGEHRDEWLEDIAAWLDQRADTLTQDDLDPEFIHRGFKFS